jgi:hypothetical protein
VAFDGYNGGSGNWLASGSTLAHGIGTGDFTIAGWWYPIATSIDHVIGMSIGARASANSVTLQLSGSDLKFRAFGSDGNYTFNTVLSLNAWVHLAVRRSGTTITGWVNGVQEATTWSGYALGSGSIATGNVYVNGAPSAFVGKSHAAEVAVWSSALSAGDLLALARTWSPWFIAPSTRKLWLPLGGLYGRNVTPLTGALAFTGQNGAITYVEHPPIMYGDDAQVGLASSGGGGGATPWLYARHRSHIIGGGVT